ncbi:unnamed protein product [Lathyrus sativus]|nr:unnamed protein product [Lathyrus sativus]
MPPFKIPWSCLDSPTFVEPKLTRAQVKPPETSKTTKTFIEVLSNFYDIPLSQLPQPCLKGDRLAIDIPKDEYIVGVEAWKHNHHGHIIWPIGMSLLIIASIKTKLGLYWKDLSKWGIISLRKGFYEFSFSSLEDVRRVRSSPSWNLDPSYLKLFSWTGDFNPNL